MRQSITPIQIRFCDVDKMNHVNNAVYLSYLELARLNYFKEVSAKIDWYSVGVIFARMEIDYRIPVMLNDKIFVKTHCSRIGNKSFNLTYSMYKIENDKEIEVATANSVQVCYDYKLNKSKELPKEWRKWLEL
ncbi:MAG: acyl-CoA thioesterase [Bacteroidia bacterium]